MSWLPQVYIEEEWLPAYMRAMRFVAVMNTASALTSAYLIIGCSPRSMKYYKWFLLNVTTCCYVFDTYQSTIYIPFMTHPIFGGCALGLMKNVPALWKTGLPWAIQNELLGICGVSLLCAAFFRLWSIGSHRPELMLTPGTITLMAIGHLLYALPAAAMSYWLNPGKDYADKQIPHLFPDAAGYFLSHACTIFVREMSEAFRYGAVALVEIFVITTAAVTVILRTYTGLRSQRKSMSEKTYRQHRTLLRALIFQFIAPSTLVVISFSTYATYNLMGVGPEQRPQLVSMVAFVVAATHSTANAAVMIYFTYPYRMEILRIRDLIYAVIFCRRRSARPQPVLKRSFWSVNKETELGATRPEQPPSVYSISEPV